MLLFLVEKSGKLYEPLDKSLQKYIINAFQNIDDAYQKQYQNKEFLGILDYISGECQNFEKFYEIIFKKNISRQHPKYPELKYVYNIIIRECIDSGKLDCYLCNVCTKKNRKIIQISSISEIISKGYYLDMTLENKLVNAVKEQLIHNIDLILCKYNVLIQDVRKRIIYSYI